MQFYSAIWHKHVELEIKVVFKRYITIYNLRNMFIFIVKMCSRWNG